MCPLILLNRWDTAGADRFKGVTTAYFRGAQGEMDNIAEFCLVGGGGGAFPPKFSASPPKILTPTYHPTITTNSCCVCA